MGDENKIDFLEPMNPKFSEVEDWRFKNLIVEKVNEMVATVNSIINMLQEAPEAGLEELDEDGDKDEGDGDNV